jgi:hypothetical protein
VGVSKTQDLDEQQKLVAIIRQVHQEKKNGQKNEEKKMEIKMRFG